MIVQRIVLWKALGMNIQTGLLLDTNLTYNAKDNNDRQKIKLK